MQGEAPGANPRLPTRLPNVTALVAHLDNGPYHGAAAHLRNPFVGEARLQYTTNITDRLLPGYVYIVGGGSSAHGLRLALIGLDGKLYVLQTKAGTLTGAFHRRP